MARQGIGTGSAPNDNTGDPLRTGAGKINDNFSEIYTRFGNGNILTAVGSQWETVNAGINTISNVGIGTTIPTVLLEVGAVGASGTSLLVNGDARVTGILTIGTASVTIDGANETINVGLVTITNSEIKLGNNITIDSSTGQVTGAVFVGDGTGLSGVVGTGAGVVVKDDDSLVGTAATINFGTNLTVSTISAGIVTVSASGDTVNQTLVVSGVSTFQSDTNFSDGADNTALFIDAAGSQIGIGTTNPDDTLDVRGTMSVGEDTNAQLSITGGASGEISQENGSLTVQGGGSTGGKIILGDNATTSIKPENGYSVELYYGQNDKKFETTNDGATVTGTLKVGTGVTVYGSSGIVSATAFYGNLTGTATTATNLSNAANITAGTIDSDRLSGSYTIDVSGTATAAQGLSGTPNINVGILTSGTAGAATTSYLSNVTLQAYSEKLIDVGNTGANYTYTLADGNYFKATLDQTSTFVFDTTNAPSQVYSFVIQLKNGTGGPFSITWPVTVNWPASTEPTRTTTDGRTDIWSFITTDGGTTWLGNLNIVDYDI